MVTEAHLLIYFHPEIMQKKRNTQRPQKKCDGQVQVPINIH